MDKILKRTIQKAKNYAVNATSVNYSSTHRYRDPTLCQMTLLIIFIGVSITYVFRKFTKNNKIPDPEIDNCAPKTIPDPEIGQKCVQDTTLDPKMVKYTHNASPERYDTNSVANNDVVRRNSPEKAAVQVQPVAMVQNSSDIDDFLRRIIIFGLLMGYYFLCDYIKIFPELERTYNRDEFLFLVFLLFLVGCSFTIRPTPDKILNRNQTEEWKGWMQIMFVWYHYFSATEWYNWIRIYIACYVWMTGFGNFSFFWVKKDFSLWRMLKMLFRLNFLVIFVVMATNNQYMLYYICAMHTYWFFSVYFFMGVLSSWNEHRLKMALKFFVYFVCNALIFDIPGSASIVFYPLQFILGFNEPKHGIMHEWAFRGGLDHWVCFVGMLCAYNYPTFESFIKCIEEKAATAREQYLRWAIKVVMVSSALFVGFLWYLTIMRKEKYSYNKLHPYTSFIPIVVFIVLRNSFPILRRYYIYMFEWLGKITLETYLSQLHVYLQANAKKRINYIPGYHFINFALATIIYLGISHTLFNLTIQFSTFLIPRDMRIVLRHFVIGVVVTVLAFGIAFSSKSVL